jgi:hypothetical protein
MTNTLGLRGPLISRKASHDACEIRKQATIVGCDILNDSSRHWAIILHLGMCDIGADAAADLLFLP